MLKNDEFISSFAPDISLTPAGADIHYYIYTHKGLTTKTFTNMKKIYSLALAVMGFLFSQGAMAQTKEYLETNYEVTTTLDFSTKTYSSDPSITLGDKTGTTAWETGNKKQQELYHVTAPEELVGKIAFQGVAGSKGWAMRSSKGGLWCYNANRSAAVLDLKANQVVAFYCTQSPSNVMTLTDGDGNPDGPFTYSLDADNNAYYATMTADGQVGFCGAKSKGYISSIVVYTPKAGAEFVTYTIKYVDEEGNEIATSSTGSGMVGAQASLSSDDKNSIWTADSVKYIYVSDDSESQTVAADGTTVVTVKFRKAEVVSFKLDAFADDGTWKETLLEGTSYEDETLNLAFPEYIEHDGTLYETAKQNKGYYIDVLMVGTTVETSIEYAKTDITDVVYLEEGEDIEGLTPVTSANSAIRSSNGSAAYAAEADVQLTTLPAGKYQLGAVIFDANKSPNTDWNFIAGTDTVFTFNVTTVNYQAGTSEEFTVTQDNTPVYFAKAGNVNSGLDLVYIVKTGDYEAPEIVANSIAELKALPSGTDVTFKATDVYVSCASNMSYTHYLQDATGGIVMDMNLTMALSGGAFEQYGDSAKFSGTLACQYVNEGTPTLTISETTGEKTSLEFSKGILSPKVLTVAEAKNKSNTAIEQTLVMVKNAKIISVDPNDSYATDMYLIQGTDTIGFSDPFFTQGWEFTAPTTLTDVDAVAGILVNDENLGIRTIYAYTDSALVYGAGEAPVEIEGLAGLKDVEYGTRVAINLKDVAITMTADLWGENIVVAQDGAKGVYMTGTLATMLAEKGAKAGKKLEGKLYATYSQNSEDKSVSLETTPVWTEKSELTIDADTVVAPIVVSIPDIRTNDYYARYVVIENVAIPDTSYSYYFYLNDGKDSVLVYDNLGNLPDDFTFPKGNVDVEGIAMSMLDMDYETEEYFTNYYVLPLSVVETQGAKTVEVEGLAGLKNVESGSSVAIKITNAVATVNLADEMGSTIVVQDADGAVAISGDLAAYLIEKGLDAGKSLNGTIYATFTDAAETGAYDMLVGSDESASSEITVADSTVVAEDITFDDIAAGTKLLRYVKISNVALSGGGGMAYATSGDDMILVYDMMGKIDWEAFTADEETGEFAGTYNVKGILMSMGMNYLLPIAADGVELVGTDGISNVKINATNNATIYTIGGVKVSGKNLQKGLYIIGGKKVVVK